MEKWFGMLTIDNCQQVMKMIADVLAGKKYTFVAVNFGYCHANPETLDIVPSTIVPEVRTGQKLRDSGIWYADKENDPPHYAGFHFGDTYGVWGASTTATKQDYDGKFDNPYIVIEYDKIKIYHRAPKGHMLAWVIAVEH